MTFVDLFEFCNRKASKLRSINSRTNHSIFRWFLPLHWLFLDLLCFAWYISFRFVILHFASFRFFIFRFVSLYFVSFCDSSFRFVSFRSISFPFFNVRFVSLYFVSVCDTSFRFVSFLHFSFRFVVFRFVSFRFVSFSFLSLVVLVFPLSYTNFVKKTFFYKLTLFLRSRAMHKLLTYFSFLKPCEMTTFYRENIWNKTII
jgi:hypothetical protein